MDIKRFLSTVLNAMFAGILLAGMAFAVEETPPEPNYAPDGTAPVEQNTEILGDNKEQTSEGMKIQKIEFSGNKLIQDSDITFGRKRADYRFYG